ncbi:MAG: carboxypeptidase regulatory-like domain-containing protein [Bacillota bacterium]
MRKVWALLFCTLLLAAALPVSAGPSQALLVQVGDRSGNPLPGATVEVYGLGQGMVALLTAGDDGTVRVPYEGRQLWMLRVSAKGYRVQESGWIDPAYGGVKLFKLEPWGGNLQVILRNEAGERVNGQVTLLAPGGAIVAHEQTKGGRFTSQGLSAGDYRLVAAAKGLGAVEQPVTVVAGRTTVQTVLLRDGSFAAVGEVVDGVTHKPLTGAQVELLRDDGILVGTASTNPLGRFRLTAPLVRAGGSYSVRVTQSGYVPEATSPMQTSPGQTLDFTGTGRIQLMPATGSIAGALVNRDGQPIANAELVLLRQGLGEVATSKTDEAGEFRFEGLAAGVRYQVVADDVVNTYRAEWHHLLASDWIEAKPGVTVQTSVVAQSWVKYPLGQGTVGGRVTNPSGLPVDGAAVELIRFTRVMESTTTDEDGLFSFASVEASEKDGFALTPYMIRISKDGFVATREVTVAGEQRSTFAIPAGARLMVEAKLNPDRVVPRGRVTDLQGRPVAGAEVRLSVIRQAEERQTVTDADGWYQLGEVPTTLASASLGVTMPEYLPASGLDVTSALAGGGRLPTVQLTPRRSTLEGVVVDLAGKPVPNASVKLWDGDAVVAESPSDPDGFYRIEADLTAAPLALLTVDRKGYTRAGAVLPDLPGPGARASQALWTRPETATISGRVSDEAGRPVGAVQVELALEGQGVVKRALSRPDGTYRFEVTLEDGATWAWLRARPAVGTFAGSVSHGLDYAPLVRVGAGSSVIVDLRVRP